MTYDEGLVYPSIGGSAAAGGSLDVHKAKDLYLTFNCLGVEGTTTLAVWIDVPLHRPLVIYIEKECSEETGVQKVAESLWLGEERYSAMTVAFFLVLLLLVCTCVVTGCNLAIGRSLEDSIPCCGKFVAKMIQGEATNGDHDFAQKEIGVVVNAGQMEERRRGPSTDEVSYGAEDGK